MLTDNLIMKPDARIVTGMSGGVDSSVAAALLVEQGYDVIGITIKTYDYESVGGNIGNDSSCCSLDGINDARRVCSDLGIPHYVLDFSEAFREQVIEPFIGEYLQGRTPNPCVLCNRGVKWERLIRKGLSIGADYVAMGHYARIGHDEQRERFWISRGNDSSKDQSYALWMLNQDSIRRTIFPLAGHSKEEVRKEAGRLGIHVEGKNESYEICFIPDDDYGRFLRENVDGLDRRVEGGDILFEGKKVGQHSGYPFYTIGQRRGLNLAVGEPVYVTEIDPENNTISVGRNNELLHTGCILGDVNMQKHPFPAAPQRVLAKVRYRDSGSPATLIPQADGTLLLQFDEAKRAITPGQSSVCYDGDDIVCGGIIRSIVE